MCALETPYLLASAFKDSFDNHQENALGYNFERAVMFFFYKTSLGLRQTGFWDSTSMRNVF